jgi:hypothetical protein
MEVEEKPKKQKEATGLEKKENQQNCLHGDFYVLNVCIEYEVIGKTGVLYVVQRCVYFALHVGKKETPCYKKYIFLKKLR